MEAAPLKPKVLIQTNSAVSFDGVSLFAKFSGPTPPVWNTGLQIDLPPDYFCWFVPDTEFAGKQVILKSSTTPQPLNIKFKGRLKKDKILGTLHFFQALEPLKSVKIVWEE